MHRFAILLLVVSLFLPQVVWAAHVSGHEQVVSASESHAHGHAHELADAPVEHESADETDDQVPLSHNHSPIEQMAAPAVLGEPPLIGSVSFAPIVRTDLPDRRLPQAATGSLLRPPRTA